MKSPNKKKWWLWKIPAIWRFLLKDGDFSKVILVFRGGLKNPIKKKGTMKITMKKRIRLYIFIFSAILLKTALRKWIQKKLKMLQTVGGSFVISNKKPKIFHIWLELQWQPFYLCLSYIESQMNMKTQRLMQIKWNISKTKWIRGIIYMNICWSD